MNKKQLLIVLLLLVIVPAGFYTKYYSGPYSDWIADSMGGFVYVIFWCLFVGLVFPSANPVKIAWIVFGCTSLIELTQLWDPPLLEAIRSTYLGRTLVGNAFSWLDFPYYAAGALMGWLLLKAVHTASAIKEHTSDQP